MVEDGSGVVCALCQCQCECGLMGEVREEVHLGEAELGVLWPVEDLQDSQDAVVVEQGCGHEPLRYVAGCFGGVAGEAWV